MNDTWQAATHHHLQNLLLSLPILIWVHTHTRVHDLVCPARRHAACPPLCHSYTAPAGLPSTSFHLPGPGGGGSRPPLFLLVILHTRMPRRLPLLPLPPPALCPSSTTDRSPLFQLGGQGSHTGHRVLCHNPNTTTLGPLRHQTQDADARSGPTTTKFYKYMTPVLPRVYVWRWMMIYARHTVGFMIAQKPRDETDAREGGGRDTHGPKQPPPLPVY